MKGPKSESVWALVMLLGLALVALSEVRAVHGAWLSPTQCKEERRLAINMCQPIMVGQPSSPGCCERVRLSHYQCVCSIFTPRVTNVATVNKPSSCSRAVGGGSLTISNAEVYIFHESNDQTSLSGLPRSKIV